MSKKQKPEIINLSEEKLNEIKSRLLITSIPDDDKKIILTIITTYAWLTCQLRSTKLTIKRLKNLFGFTTERRSNKNKKEDDQSPSDLNGLSIQTARENVAQEGEVNSEKKSPNGTLSKTMAD